MWGPSRAPASGGPRTLTGSSHSWKGRGVWLQTARLGEAWLPDSLNAPTREGDARRGGGFRGFPDGPRQRGPCLAGGRPLLHEALLLGSRKPSGPQNTQKPRKSRFGGFVLGPPHDEPFSGHPTGGETPVQRGGLALICRAGQTGRKATHLAVWPLPQRQGGQGGGRFCTKMLLLGSRNALRTTEHAETQKIGLLLGTPHDEPFRAT